MSDKKVSNLAYAGVITLGLGGIVWGGMQLKDIAANMFNPVNDAIQDITVPDNSKCDTPRARVDMLYARRHGCN